MPNFGKQGVVLNDRCDEDLAGGSMQAEKLRDKAAPASALLKAMSNRHRLMILCHLLGGELCVGDMEQLVGVSQSALSQHLARLRRDSLVTTRRDAQTIYYSLAGQEARAVLEALYRLFCQAPQRAGERASAAKAPALVER
jgi:DNA-binding transcriptional ArsR family regulator